MAVNAALVPLLDYEAVWLPDPLLLRTAARKLRRYW